MMNARGSILLALVLTGCAGHTPPTAGPVERYPLGPQLDAVTLLLDNGLSARSETIAGTRGSRQWLTITAGDAADYEAVAEALAKRLGPPTCSGSSYAQWDGRFRIQAYRPHVYATMVIIESPPDPVHACQPASP